METTNYNQPQLQPQDEPKDWLTTLTTKYIFRNTWYT